MTAERKPARAKKNWMKKRKKGSVMDVFPVFLFVLVFTVVMMAYVGSAQILDSKVQITQIARKYILRMETVGYLAENDRITMQQELMEAGVEQVDLSGSTLQRVTYGDPIYLVIRGRISLPDVLVGSDLFQTVLTQSGFWFEERKMSTAKN